MVDSQSGRAAAAGLPVQVPHIAWWVLILGGISALACLVVTDNKTVVVAESTRFFAPLWFATQKATRADATMMTMLIEWMSPIHSMGRACLGDYWWMRFVRGLLYASVSAHIVEGSAAWLIAAGRGRHQSIIIGWVIQTLLLGGPSLKLLLAQRDL
jgi:hypothetical protein